MITVYGRATSSNVQPVTWALALLGEPFERLDYGHPHGGLDTPAFRAMNPHGLVPVIRDGDLVMWESCAILRYLAARYGRAPFWPEDPVARAPVDMWAEWAKTTLAPAITPVFWLRVRTAAAERAPGALDAALARAEAMLDRLEAQLAPFLAGPDLTPGDLVVAPHVHRWHAMDIPRRHRPRLADYYARLQERPGFREHVMVSWAPLEAAGA